jgi:hypothetical protein
MENTYVRQHTKPVKNPRAVIAGIVFVIVVAIVAFCSFGLSQKKNVTVYQGTLTQDQSKVKVIPMGLNSVNLDWSQLRTSSNQFMIAATPSIDPFVVSNTRNTVIQNLDPKKKYVFCVYENAGWEGES